MSQRYARVSEDGEDVGMISSKATTRAAPVEEKTPLWKYVAAGVVFVVLLIPAVAYTSSTMLEYRLAAAVQDAQAKQNTTVITKPEKSTAEDSDNPVVDEGLDLMSAALANATYELRDCGSNADEARANGCEFDVMMQEWTPPECIDYALSEKFLKDGNWTWYADASAEKIYNDTEIRLGNHDVVFVDQSYHRHHCIFTWERLVRAMRTQKPLVEKLVDYDHVMHCRMNTLKTFEEGAKPVRGVVAPTAFTSCASYDVWLQHLPRNKMSSIERMLKM